MPRPPQASLPFESPPLGLTLAFQQRLYVPMKGLRYSLLLHFTVLMILILLPVTPRSPEERSLLWPPLQPRKVEEPQGPRFVMYLPSIGGGRQGGGPRGGGQGQAGTPGGQPAARPSPGKQGIVYPGPQVIRSEFPEPTHSKQTLLQPEIQNLPTVREPFNLPNLVSIPKSSDFRRPPPPQPKPAEPREERRAEVPQPKPLPTKIEELPAPVKPARSTNLLTAPEVRPVAPPPSEVAVGLADPDQAKDEQPMDLKSGSPVEPLQMELQDLPTQDQVSSRQRLIAKPDTSLPPEPVEAPQANEPEEKGSDQPREESESNDQPDQPVPPQEPAKEALAPLPPAQLPTRTDLPKFLALSPDPAPVPPVVEIPAGEAKANFTIAPESNLDSPVKEPGVPGPRAAAESTEPRPSPPVVAITFGPGGKGTGSGSGSSGTGSGGGTGSGPGSGSGSGSGTGSGSGPGSGAGGSGTGSGSGSGPGSGSGAGSGSGTGSGAGSGPGTGSFAGITILGGTNSSSTASSGSGARGGSPTGIRVIGGFGPKATTPDANKTTITLGPAPRPVATNYGVFVLSTANSGGGLPFIGVFENEQIHTVYLDMRQSETDRAPFWTFEFAVPPEATNRPLSITPENDSPKGFSLPNPKVKRAPALPADLVRPHTEKMVIVYGVVNREGKLAQMSVKVSPEPGLDQPILDALSRWVFEPGLVDGSPVEVRLLIGVPLWLP